jgi:hypothetical protein
VKKFPPPEEDEETPPVVPVVDPEFGGSGVIGGVGVTAEFGGGVDCRGAEALAVCTDPRQRRTIKKGATMQNRLGKIEREVIRDTSEWQLLYLMMIEGLIFGMEMTILLIKLAA